MSSYPLSWPVGRARTPREKTARSKFDTSFSRARSKLIDELRLLGAKNQILSTNIELRIDGLPYANRPEPRDRGAAVYFESKGRQMAFACDRWDKVGDNIYAIAKTIEALRGIARWGTGDMMEAAFRGFAALPAPRQGLQGPSWRTVMGYDEDDYPALEDVERRYKQLAMDRHEDRGGTNDAMLQLNVARDAARRELGAPTA